MQLRCSCCSEVYEFADKVVRRRQFCVHCNKITRFTEASTLKTRTLVLDSELQFIATEEKSRVDELHCVTSADSQNDGIRGAASTTDGVGIHNPNPFNVDQNSAARNQVTDAALLNDVLLRVRFLHTKCSFADAVQLLRELDDKHRTSDITSLLMQSLYLSDLKESATEAARRAILEHQSCFKQTEVIQYQESLRSLNLEDPDFINPLIPGPKHSRDFAKWTSSQKAVTVVVMICLLTLISVLAIRLQQLSAASGGRKSQLSSSQEKASLLNTLNEKNSGTAESKTSLNPAEADSRNGAGSPTSLAEKAARFLSEGNAMAASGVSGKTGGAETTEAFADRIGRSWKSDLTELEDPRDPQQRRKTREYLNSIDRALETADQGQDQIRIRQVRSEVLNQMARLLISEGNFPEAIDTLTKAAVLLPDDPENRELAGQLAETMVSGLESGDGRINLEIVVPWIDQTEQFGVPLDLRSALHRRARGARLLSIRNLQKEGTERSLLLAVDAMKTMKNENSRDSDIMAAEVNLTQALLEDAENALDTKDLKSASMNLKAAVSLQGTPEDASAASGRIARKIEHEFSRALDEKQFAAVADLYEMLKLLAPARLFAADDALRRLSMTELSLLPEWLRDLILKRTNSIAMKFSLVPQGAFLMGAANTSQRRDLPDYPESPQHQVTLSKPCYLGQFEVTLAQYQEIMIGRPDTSAVLPALAPAEDSSGDTGNLPCDGLTWFQAAMFCEVLSGMESEQAAGRRYRLPSEAEWEFACRADSTTHYADNNSVASIAAFAWYANNSGRLMIDERLSLQNDYQRMVNLIARTQPRLHPTGEKMPNVRGFYDMHGNAAEWVQDWYAAYTDKESRDPAGPEVGTEKVLRGGSFRDDFNDISGSRRFAAPPDRALAGFRVVLEYFPVAAFPEPAR